MMNKLLFLTFLVFLTGCINFTIEPKVEATKHWENHYFNVEDFKKSTQNIELSEGESIWVLSNTTLSRLLKNVKDR